MRIGRCRADSRTCRKAEARRSLRRHSADAYARHRNGCADLFFNDVAQPRVKLGKKVGGRKAAVVYHVMALVRGIEIAVRHNAAKQPCHPVARLNDHVAFAVYIGRLGIELPYLREHPLARHLAAEGAQPLFAAACGDLGHALGVLVRRMVLPEFEIRVLVALVFIGEAEGRAVGVYRHNGAAGEVDADAYNIALVYSRARNDLGDYMLQHERKVVRVFKRPVGRKLFARFGQGTVDNAVRVVHDRVSHFMAVAHSYEQRAPRKGAEINADSILVTHLDDASPFGEPGRSDRARRRGCPQNMFHTIITHICRFVKGFAYFLCACGAFGVPEDADIRHARFLCAVCAAGIAFFHTVWYT